MLRTAVLCALVTLCTASVCVKSYQKIGCKAKNRAIFTDALANNRDKGSDVFTGEILKWGAFGESINKLACQCQEKAKEGGYVAFALGFYGECYGAKDRMAVLGHVDADGGLASHKCMDGLFQTGCGKDHEGECVGVADAEYIYTLDNNNKASDTQHNGNKQNEEEENEKVDGGLGEWTEWTTCSESCGEGIQDRERLCNNPSPANGGKDCKDLGELTKTKTCKIKDCPVNGNWSEWFEDGECSVSCGGGVQKLTRTCTNPKPQFGGEDCKGENEKSQTCGTKECPVNGNWSDWSNYEKCSVSCGGGVQKRTRTCTNPEPQFDGEECDGDSEETRNCGTKECPINGKWSDWSNYGDCNASCGGGMQKRTRTCTNPEPQFNGEKCDGESEETQSCGTKECPINGKWSDWSNYEKCSVSCGGGVQKRARTCTNPKPKFDGEDCDGDSEETQNCGTKECPINGGWSSWGSYGSCSKLCGGGLRTQTRSCTNPRPQYKGNQCSGGTTQHQACNTHHCPINGGWSSWGSYGSCPKPCGGGLKTRTRSCTNPKPEYKGNQCSGGTTQHQACNTHHCPIHGGWSRWGSYGSCSKSCGGGLRTRTRSCTNPKPQYKGNQCSGGTTQHQTCNTNHCPVHGGWSSWGSYGSCSRSCGGGSQTRRRTCSNPTPQYNGRTCSGSSSQAQSCKTNHCPVHASWSGYGSYGSCSKTCHYGRKTKYRTCRGARYGGRKTCSGSSSHTINCNVNVRCPFYTAFHSNKVCEGGWMKMYCTDKNQKMKLDGSYFYGRKNKSSCKGGIDWFWSTSCSGGRSKVYNACQNKNECKIYANNSWMGGDPCRGTPKYYYVNFRCYG